VHFNLAYFDLCGLRSDTRTSVFRNERRYNSGEPIDGHFNGLYAGADPFKKKASNAHAKEAAKAKGETNELIDTDWRELYGVAVSDLSIAPSEVRNMTVGEIYSIIWARTRSDEPENDYEELYELLQELKSDG
jgi:hypothetical protein